MKINHCNNCGAEQQEVDVDDFTCERCGARNRADGWTEVPQDESQMREDMDFSDHRNGYHDREDYFRNNR